MSAALNLAFHGFTRHAVMRCGRQHSVFRSQPAFTGILLETRNALLHRSSTHHAGVAELNQNRTGWIGGEIAGNTDTSQLVEVTTIRTLKISHALKGTARG